MKRNNSTKTTKFITALAATTFIAFALTETLKSQPAKLFAGIFPVPVRPITLYSHEMVWKTGNAPAISTERTEAYRPDGSYAKIEKRFRLGSDEPLETHRDILVTGGVQSRTSDHIQAVTTTANPHFFDRYIRMAFDPRTNCAQRFGPSQLGRTPAATPAQQMLGYRVQAFTTDSKTARFTVWAAPELNCAELHRLAEFKGPGGNVTDSSELIVDRLSPGMPEPALFQVPQGFHEVSPSERYRLEVQIRNAAIDETAMAALKQMGASYLQNRPTP